MPLSDCGLVKRSASGKTKVINGDKAEVGEYPWMAALYITKDGKRRFNCGGTLISQDVVVTAGHCVDE